MLEAKINKNQSLSILYSLRSILKMGDSLPNAIKLLSQVEKGAVKQVLSKVVYLIFDANVYPEDALERFGIISKTEVFILRNSLDAKDAFSNIIQMREVSNRFEKSMMTLLGFPVIAVVIGLLIAYFAQPTFSSMVNTLVKQVSVTKGVDISDDVQLMWYLKDQNLDFILLVGYIILIISLISLYLYLLEYKPSSLYKVFKLKAYDDVPYLLMMMNNLHKAGFDPKRIFDILAKTSIKKGWVSLFTLLEKEATQGGKLYTIFERYGFPQDIVLILKSSEIGKSYWDSMDSLIEYVNETNKQKNEMLKKVFGNVATVVGFSIVIYFTVGLFMAMFSLQSISTALM